MQSGLSVGTMAWDTTVKIIPVIIWFSQIVLGTDEITLQHHTTKNTRKWVANGRGLISWKSRRMRNSSDWLFTAWNGLTSQLVDIYHTCCRSIYAASGALCIGAVTFSRNVQTANAQFVSRRISENKPHSCERKNSRLPTPTHAHMSKFVTSFVTFAECL